MTLRVKLEIVRFGNENDVREIGRLDISNVTFPAPTEVSEYQVVEAKGPNPGAYDKTVVHSRADGAWQLVAKAIDELDIRGP